MQRVYEGVLLEENGEWFVNYEVEPAGDNMWYNKLPLHPDDFTFQLFHGKKVRIVIQEEPALKECSEGETNYNINYAKIVES